jgi:type VI secretion system secreted protein VgrG
MALVDHPRLATREDMLLLEIRHEASMPFFHKKDAEPPVYRSEFRAIPAGVVYRPPRRTPKPRMPSVVTGIIQPGPGGEVGGTARLDTEGRYTVQLHFDTAPPGGSKSSHPIRMSQPFAGQGNAMHFPLLPGTEVLVAFANGDPDRPVIIGALPNVTSPSAINVREARKHRLETSKGILVEFGITDRVRARTDKS